MRVVARDTGRSPLSETIAAQERFHNKTGLAEAAVFEMSVQEEFSIGARQVSFEEPITATGIIQFAVRPRRADGGLHMTLRADGYGFGARNPGEIDRRFEGIFLISLALHVPRDVFPSRPVAHLAVNSWFAKFQVLRLEASAFCVSQLAGVADGTVHQVVCGRAEFLP